MYICVRGINFASFYEFSIGFWNYSDLEYVFFYFSFYLSSDILKQCTLLVNVLYPFLITVVLGKYYFPWKTALLAPMNCSVLLKMMLSIIIDVLLFILSVLFHASLISETNVNLTV